MFRKTLESIALSIPLLSCGILVPTSEDPFVKNLIEQGYNPYHSGSCGPNALHKLLKQFEIYAEPKDLSREIIEQSAIGNILRAIPSLVDSDSRKITWPWEIESILERYLGERYQINKKTGAPDEMDKYFAKAVGEGKKGLILLKKRAKMDHHWAAFPSNQYLLAFYGSDTIVLSVYSVEKK